MSLLTPPLIEKIHFLETKLGDRWIHPILEPFTFDSSDSIKIQEAAKIIAQHLALPPFTFIITYAHQKTNVGGHVNLDNSKEVFIEIDGKYKNDCDMVLAVLAHEICHKYLYFNNLKKFPDFENEMLTDAATVFTGLGKLSLNGCQKVSVKSEKSNDTTTTTTTTQKVGYMNRKQFACVYLLFCEMRKIPKLTILKGLTPEAENDVRSVAISEDKYFNDSYFINDFALNEISDAIKNEIGDTLKNFANFNRNIRVIQESILTSAHQICKDFHLNTKAETETLQASASKTFNKASQIYINNLVVHEGLETLISKISDKNQEMKAFGNVLPNFISVISESYPNQFSNQTLEFLLQFDCPTCNSKMRISEKKLARVKCPKCNYSFVIDTRDETVINKIIKNELKRNRAIKQTQKGFWRTVKEIFR